MSFHSSGEHVPTTHATGEPSPHSGGPEGGNKTTHYPPEDIHSTGAGIAGTATRMRSISQDVGQVHVDAKSFGALNGVFAEGVQSHVTKAQSAVSTTSDHVNGASEATHQTSVNMENTDADSAGRFTAIANGTDTPKAPGRQSAGPGGSGPGGAPPRVPPAPTPRGEGTGGGSGAPPGGGGPHGGGGPSAPRESWRQTMRREFTPAEQAELHDALHKMAQPPKPGEVAGSGQLTPHQQELVARLQSKITIDPGTPMQKVLPAGSAADYLNNTTRAKATDGWNFDPNQVGGFVGRQQDAAGLHTPTQMIDGNRLDYPGTRFAAGDPNAPIYVMKFPATQPDRYSTPLGAPFDNGPGMLGEHDPAVQSAAQAMTGHAGAAGIPSGAYHEQVSAWPYSGIGVTAHETLGLPERVMTTGKVPDGAEMWMYDKNGNQTLVGTYDQSEGQWFDPRAHGGTP